MKKFALLAATAIFLCGCGAPKSNTLSDAEQPVVSAVSSEDSFPTAEPADGSAENPSDDSDELMDSLRKLTENYLLYYDITSARYKATKSCLSEDGLYCIYEFEKIKTWKDFLSLAQIVFTKSEYEHQLDVLNNGEYSDYYVKNADGRIGVLRNYDMTVLKMDEFYADDLEILSEDGEKCVYECRGTRYKDGEPEPVSLEITAVMENSQWRISGTVYP